MKSPRHHVLVGSLAVLAALNIFTQSVAQTPTSGQVVDTDRGQIRGVLAEGVEAFRGIPFAAPPVGDLRWKAPQPAAAWVGVRDGSIHGSVCPQKYNIDSPRVENEDCLYLYVERPVGVSAKDKLPVFFYIHGGGFTGGYSPQEDPEKIVREVGVISVTINYRLGTLGFLALPGLSAEGGNAKSGNYAIQDQQAALRWVQSNIAKFGGDPARVTIAGESAGATAVCNIMVSPESPSLFSQAIIQSGGCRTRPLKEAEYSGEQLASALLCPDTDPATQVVCMRRKSVAAILDERTITGAVSGTSTFPNDARKDLAAGNFARVPVIFGAMRHEGRSFQRLNVGMSKEGYEAFVRAQFGANSAAVLSQYPWPANATRATPAYLMANITTDGGNGGCSSRKTLHDLSKYTKTYWYEFTPNETSPGWYTIEGYNWGDGHALDLFYLFPKRNNGKFATDFNASEKQLSNDVVQYWGEFVKTGQPSAKGSANWPSYNASQKIMSLRVAGKSALMDEDDYAKGHNCAFWETLQDRPAT